MSLPSEPDAKPVPKKAVPKPPPDPAKFNLTPSRYAVLAAVVECGLLTVTQMARFTGLSEAQVYRDEKYLADYGYLKFVKELTDRLEAPGKDPVDNLRYGRVSRVFYPVPKAVKLAHDLGLYAWDKRHIKALQDSSPILPHDVGLREVRVRMEEWKRAHPDHQVKEWRDGTDARFPHVHPDAAVTYRTPKAKRTCAVEWDRGTGEGPEMWTAKREGYGALLAEKGWEKTLVLVVAPDGKRVRAIAKLLSDLPPEKASRFLITTKTALLDSFPGTADWTVPGREGLWPFLHGDYL